MSSPPPTTSHAIAIEIKKILDSFKPVYEPTDRSVADILVVVENGEKKSEQHATTGVANYYSRLNPKPSGEKWKDAFQEIVKLADENQKERYRLYIARNENDLQTYKDWGVEQVKGTAIREVMKFSPP